MNVVLSLMRRDQWTAQKNPFWADYICLLFAQAVLRINLRPI